MEKFDLYLFDFDGTLINTLPALIYVFTASFKAVGVDVTPEQCLQCSREPLQISYAKYNAPMDKIPFFVEMLERSLRSQESIEKSFLFEDTLPLLNYLKENNIPFGLVTSNDIQHVTNVLNHLKMDINDFAVVVDRTKEKREKPQPYPILKALEELHYAGDLSKVCYVGDALNDVIAAKNAWVTPILINRGEKDKKADCLMISSLNELK